MANLLRNMTAMAGQEQAKMAADIAYRQPTLGERLRQRQASLTAELQTVNEAIDKLEANPVIEEVLNFVSKVGM